MCEEKVIGVEEVVEAVAEDNVEAIPAFSINKGFLLVRGVSSQLAINPIEIESIYTYKEEDKSGRIVLLINTHVGCRSIVMRNPVDLKEILDLITR